MLLFVFCCCFQKWRKELAKNRVKMLGDKDKEKEKEKKATDKEKKLTDKEKDEKKKEVWLLSPVSDIYRVSLSKLSRSLTLALCLYLEKEEGKEEVQQGEESSPLLATCFAPLIENLGYVHITGP